MVLSQARAFVWAVTLVLVASLLVLAWESSHREARFGSTATAPGFSDTDIRDLASQGFMMSPPSTYETPTIDEAAAVGKAAHFAAGEPVQGDRLFHVRYAPSTTQPSLFECLCYVVSVMPPGGTSIAKGPVASTSSMMARVTYSLVFIDAHSGQRLFAIQVSQGLPASVATP